MKGDRTTISGTLHVTEIYKRRNSYASIGNLIAERLAWDLRKEWTDKQYRKWFYAPSYWIADTGILNARGREKIYKFKANRHGQVYGTLDRFSGGKQVTVTATLDEWPNGNGAWLLHPVVSQ